MKTVKWMAILALLVCGAMPAAGGTQTWSGERTSTATTGENGARTVSGVETIKRDGATALTVNSEKIVTRNADGTLSWNLDRIAVDDQGRKGTSTAQGTSRKTADGREWTSTASGTNRKAEQWNSQTNGASKKTDTGRTWSSRTNGTVADRTWTTQRAGSMVRNDDGTRTEKVNATRTESTGKTWTTQTERTITKTGDHSSSWTGTRKVIGPKGTAEYNLAGNCSTTKEGNTTKWTATHSATKR